MKFPGYPSNREADEGADKSLPERREDVPEDEAKPGDLEAYETLLGLGGIMRGTAGYACLTVLLPSGGAFFAPCPVRQILKKEREK